MVEPIKPSEVGVRKIDSIPTSVIEAFNKLIAQRWDGKESKFTQKTVVDVAIEFSKKKRGKTLREDEIYDNRLLDVESIYEDQGWEVEYDKPGYNESYPAEFIFRKK